MPATVIGTSLNLGYAGTPTRQDENVVRARANSDSTAISFGSPVILYTDNTYKNWGASNVAADFAGVAIVNFKTNTSYVSSITSNGAYAVNEMTDVLEKGSVIVTCTEGTPTAGGAVYLMTVAGTTSPVGAFVATSTPAGSGATAVKLTNAQWATGKIDASGACELTILSRNKA